MNADIPLAHVCAGMYLLLADDVLLGAGPAADLLSEPRRVVVSHRGGRTDERRFIQDGGIIIRAAGWRGPDQRAVSLEMTGPGEALIMVCFPDNRHLVAAVNLPDPAPIYGPADASGRAPWGQAVPIVVDLATRHAHDATDLSAYRLPPFWRDASVVWALSIPEPWSVGPHLDLVVSEAIGGVLQPAPADIAAAETRFHEDISISMATLCWNNAVEVAVLGQAAADPVIQPVLRRLETAFSSLERLQSAAATFVDRRLALSGADLDYTSRFIAVRTALIRRYGRNDRSPDKP